MAPIDPKAAFLHVVNDYRWLAASGCAWNLVGANAANEIKDVSHCLLPNIEVAILDSLLTHARSLIDFYTNSAPRKDDITLADFNLSLDQSVSAELAKYKRPIEVPPASSDQLERFRVPNAALHGERSNLPSRLEQRSQQDPGTDN